MAISTEWIKIWKIFFWKNTCRNVVSHVPSFQFSSRSSSFFIAFFLHLCGTTFFESPHIRSWCLSQPSLNSLYDPLVLLLVPLVLLFVFFLPLFSFRRDFMVSLRLNLSKTIATSEIASVPSRRLFRIRTRSQSFESPFRFRRKRILRPTLARWKRKPWVLCVFLITNE